MVAKEDYVRIDVEEYVGLFQTLGDSMRLEIVGLLFEYEATATAIAVALEAEPERMPAHLNALREAGVVKSRQRGASVVYTLTERSREVMVALRDLVKV